MKKIVLISLVILITAFTLMTTACSKDDYSSNNGSVQKVEDKVIDFEKYVGMMNLSKDEVIKNIGEEPKKIEGNQYEFEKAGITVMFYEKGIVQLVAFKKPNISFKGAKIGDDYKEFVKAYGNPSSYEMGTAYFNLNELMLATNVDRKTNKVNSVDVWKKAKD